jgi:2,3-dihydroxybenzoate decarboxylase
MSALGRNRVMFAADYPFESSEEAAHFIDNVPLDETVRNDICFNTAVRFFKLPTS